jgi:hypothetical protein
MLIYSSNLNNKLAYELNQQFCNSTLILLYIGPEFLQFFTELTSDDFPDTFP